MPQTLWVFITYQVWAIILITLYLLFQISKELKSLLNINLLSTSNTFSSTSQLSTPPLFAQPYYSYLFVPTRIVNLILIDSKN